MDTPVDVKKKELHPAYYKLAEIFEMIGHGTVKELKIQDGIPVFLTVKVQTGVAAEVEKQWKLV